MVSAWDLPRPVDLSLLYFGLALDVARVVELSLLYFGRVSALGPLPHWVRHWVKKE